MDSVPAWHLDALAGAGALRSTASDMLSYLAAELDTLHGPLARAIALGREPRAGIGRDSIALAWVVHDVAGQRFWWHNGGTGGFRSFVSFEPARGVAMVVLSNASVGVDDIGMHLLAPSSRTELHILRRGSREGAGIAPAGSTRAVVESLRRADTPPLPP